MTAKISVVIASVNRREQLEQTVESILNQSCLPDEIIVSVPDTTHVTAKTAEMLSVKVIVGPRGSCHQRNTALDSVSPDTSYVFFFDDDMELCRFYIESTMAVMERYPEVVVAVGGLIPDGASRKRGVTREEAVRLCQAEQEALDVSRSEGAEFSTCKVGQTCAMAIRWKTVRAERFDENLPLYGWMEDLDYSYRLGKFGLVVVCHNSLAVHLRCGAGRVSGKKMGYSQIVNPLYLWRKNGSVSLVDVIYRHWLRPIAANIVGSVFRDQDVDRRGRLIGNMVAVKDVILGRAHPTSILSGRL